MHRFLSLSWRNIRWCLIVFVAMHCLLGLWAGVVLNVYPIQYDWRTLSLIRYEQVVPTGSGIGDGIWDALLSPWHRWDTEWYLKIAVQGYSSPDGRVAFGPVYPFLIRILGGLLRGHYLLAALTLSSLAALLSCLLLYDESLRLFDHLTAKRAVVYFLSFPTAFFLIAGYTESLFVLAVLLAWQAAAKEKWLSSGLLGALATLIRFPGVTLLVPLAYVWWKSDNRDASGLGLMAIPGAFVAWALHARLGPAGEFPWSPQGRVWDLRIGWPWSGPVNNVLGLLGGKGSVAPFSLFSLFLDLFVVLLFVSSVIVAFRVLPKEYVVLMLSLFLPALMKLSERGFLVSVSRYVIPVFPVFLVLARVGRRSRFNRSWLYISFFLQAIASAVFFLWRWVA
jgi:hypothetical protein